MSEPKKGKKVIKIAFIVNSLILADSTMLAIKDDTIKARKANIKYNGVFVTNDIRNNGMKKLLLMGKTGTGKSSVSF